MHGSSGAGGKIALRAGRGSNGFLGGGVDLIGGGGGGNASVQAGTATQEGSAAPGGALKLRSGNSSFSVGGDTEISGGVGTEGGSLYLSAGNGTVFDGGRVFIIGGSSPLEAEGGSLDFVGGNGYLQGGSVRVMAGGSEAAEKLTGNVTIGVPIERGGGHYINMSSDGINVEASWEKYIICSSRLRNS